MYSILGWCSLSTLERHAAFCQQCGRTEWLFCRGVPTLLEVSESSESENLPALVTAVELPVPVECEPALQAFGIGSAPVDGTVRLTIGGRQVRVRDFCGLPSSDD